MSDTQGETVPEPTTETTEAAAAPESAAPEAAAGTQEDSTTKTEEVAKEAEPTEGAVSKEETEETKEADKKEEDAAKGSTDATEEVVAEPEPEPEPIVIPEGNGELVLVTGATGYLGSHIVKHLVESEQYKVRGTVRSLEENEKLDKLKSLLGESKYEVEFVEADLTKPDSWTEAVKGCEYVIHTATPFPVTEPSDANEVVNTTRDGTLSILKASVESATVKRVVLTSSLVAVVGGNTTDKSCNEEMWADEDKLSNPYDKSKPIAEKAAWEYIKEQLPEGSNLELSVVNPGFMVGPPLMKMENASIEVLKKLMNRGYSVLPKISFACTDVRDVAMAHMRAMVIKQAAGCRHIVCKSSVWLKDMANILSQEFSSQGFDIATSESHYIMVRLKSIFNPAIKRMLPDVGKMYSLDTKRMATVLQVEPREVKDSLIEMGHSLINLEIVQKVEKPEKKSRKMTFRKKKEKIDDGEEKKDEPEKATSTSGSAENESVPDATIEDVVILDDSKPVTAEAQKTDAEEAEAPKAEAEAPKAEAPAEEAKVEGEEEKPADNAGAQSEEEVKDEASGTSDPESTKKKDKKEKPKKEKKEKKKGGLFSFSFKKGKKPNVEKKTEEAAAADETLPAEETPAAAEDQEATTATEEKPAATEEASAAAEDAPAAAEDAPAAAEEAPAATEEAPKEESAATTTEETPAETTEAKPAESAEVATEEAPKDTEETSPAAAEETPAKEETEAKPTEEPAAAEESASS